jgi:DNA excision repair protein ERCC-3
VVIKLNWNDPPADRDGTVSIPRHSAWPRTARTLSIDLPDADLLIQVSGMFGSRQEEAQRLGRILRPKTDGRSAHFVTLVSRDTREEEFAYHRQLFLTEQGYSYRVEIVEIV